MRQKNSKTAGVTRRSLNLDDYAYGLLVDYAKSMGLTYSAALGVLIRQTLGSDQAPVPAPDYLPIANPSRDEVRPARGRTILPPDSVSDFRVKNDRVEQRRSRRDEQLSEAPDK